MPVPASINDLSTTAGSNSPSGGETPAEGDNYIRSLSSFIAVLRDKLNGTSDTGTVKNATFSGTMAGAASWSGLQTFANAAVTGDLTVGDDLDVTGDLAAGNVAGTTWTPTLTAVANVASVVDNPVCQYMRVRSVVTVSGQFTIAITAGSGTLTQVGISIPVASDFAALTQASGVASSLTVSGTNDSGQISADTTNNRLTFSFYAATTATRTFKFHATYLIA